MGIGSEIGSEISSGNQLAIVLGIASMNGLGNGSGIAIVWFIRRKNVKNWVSYVIPSCAGANFSRATPSDFGVNQFEILNAKTILKIW